MGMFDNVQLTVKCPKCGADVDGFQTKEAACVLDTLQPYEVSHCYAPCRECNAWVTAEVSDKAQVIREQARDSMHRQLAHEMNRIGQDAWFDVRTER